MEMITQSFASLNKRVKPVFQRIKYRNGYEKCIFILGCQRSGTTMVSKVFDEMGLARVFGEFSSLSNLDEKRIRLNPFDVLLPQLNQVNAPLVVTKPLVESQNALKLMENIPKGHIVWVYRNYKDVALSDTKKFKKIGGLGNIEPLLENDPDNWRSEHSSEETRKVIRQIVDKHELTSVDYACLFWYARNILFFEQQLDEKNFVTIWQYEAFVAQPLGKVNELMTRLGFPTQTDKIIRQVFVDSVGKAKAVDINPEVESLCQGLLERLNKCVQA